MGEIETKTIWMYDHGSARPKSMQAIQVNGTWHYVKDDYISPLYGEGYPNEEACLRAELVKERSHLDNTQRRVERLEDQLRRVQLATS